MRRALVLVLVIIAASAALVLALAAPEGRALELARIVLALPLVFVLPGYAFTAALFPPRALSIAVRSLTSVGMSMAASILGGFMLNQLPGGLDTDNWVIWLGGLTIFCALVALVRWSRYEPPPPVPGSGIHLRLGQIALFGLAGIVVLSAIVLARQSETNRYRPGFTTLWMLPREDDVLTVDVGIRNMEGEPVGYHLQVQDSGQIIVNEPLITLADQQVKIITLRLSPARSGSVEAVLYRVDQPDSVYRYVTLSPEGR